MKRITNLVKPSAKAKTVVIAALLLTAAGGVFAKGITKKVRFPRGSKSTVIAGAVVRGDQDKYMVGARAGQQMRVSISSVEDNAVFQIYRPGSKRTLDGAGETDDARSWSGQLPDSGNYVIVVGGTRGNAEYKLSVGIE